MYDNKWTDKADNQPTCCMGNSTSSHNNIVITRPKKWPY